MKKTLITVAILSLGSASAVFAQSHYLVTPLASVERSAMGSFTVNPQTVVFDPVVIGSSAQKMVRIRNTGLTSQILKNAQVSINSNEFGVSSNCTRPLAAKSTCLLTLTYTPVQGTVPGELLIEMEPAGGLRIPLYGTAHTPADIQFSELASFNQVIIGQSETRTFTISNNGQESSRLNFNLSGLPSNIRLAKTCDTVLRGGDSCVVTLTYSPLQSQMLDASFTISDQYKSVAIVLNGQALTPPDLSVIGSPLHDYGVVLQHTGKSNTWTIHNAGEASANLPFEQLPASISKSGTCSAVLAGNSSCTLTLTWTPSTTAALNHRFEVGSSIIEVKGEVSPSFKYTVSLANNTVNYDLATAARNAGWNGTTPLAAKITVPAGYVVGSHSTGAYALVVNGIPGGSQVELINHGGIYGMGGNGGNADSNGQPGGAAIYVGYPTKIANYGVIAGGGGGGAGSNTQTIPNSSAGGAGGGGGQGYGTSAGGVGASTQGIYPRGGNGGNGHQGGAGGGGGGVTSGYYPYQHYAPWYTQSLNGQPGGGWGQPGGSYERAGGAGGAGIHAAATVTYTYRGTIYGVAP